MVSSLLRPLAILTATATFLAGIPLFAAALAPAGVPGPCLCTAPFDADDGAESRGADCSEEREEKEQEEDADGKLHLVAGGVTTVRRAALLHGRLVATDSPTARRFAGPARSIRGPPAG